MPKKIIIDTDPGVDDTIAITTALRSPELEVIGLTSVFGNATTEITTQNALRLVELEGNGHIPVARGSSVPLIAPFEHPASEVHGDDGMGNTNLPRPKGKPIDLSAAEFIVKMSHAHAHELTIAAVGPLTNLALAVRIDPGITQLIKEVVIMGGAVTVPGNITPVAEANIYHDVHAADIVMAAGWPLTIIGLDVTQKTVMTPAFFADLFKANNPAVNLIKSIVPYYQKFYDQVLGMNGAIHTHDPSAIVYTIQPELFETRSAPVFVETEGRCIGQTTADWRHRWESRKPVDIAVNVDSENVLALIKDRLTKQTKN